MTPPPFAPAFARWLRTPGPPFVAATIALDDVFVAPLAWVHDGDRRTAVDPVALALRAERLLVSGPQRIGRTTLAKRIVGAAHAAGETPVYARADFVHAGLGPDTVAARIAALTRDQYGRAPATADVLVLDDLDRARLGGIGGYRAAGRAEVLGAAAGAFRRVVAFTTEPALAARVALRHGPAFEAADLGAYDADRRAALAARYVEAVAPIETWGAFVGPARRLLVDLFADGRLPAFPYYVLVALAELYTGDSAQIDGTRLGPFYQVVVHEAARLAKTRR